MGKKRKYFYSMLLKISLVTTIIVMALSTILYLKYKDYSVELLNDSNEVYMHQVVHNAEQVNEHIKSYAISMFNSLETISLMNDESPSIKTVLNSMNALGLLLYSNLYIDSAYIYNGRMDTYYILGSDRLIRQGSFYDQELVTLLKSEAVPTLKPIARKMPMSQYNEGKLDVLTYVIPEYFPGSKRLKNALILNVRTDNYLGSLTFDKNNNQPIFFIKADGTVQAHEDSSVFLTNVSHEEYMGRILASSEESNHFIDQVNGQSSIVTYVKSQSLDWKLVSIIPYAQISHHLKGVQYITLTIALVMLAMSIVIMFYISKHLYNPVMNMRNKIIQQLSNQVEEATVENEFEDVIAMFSSTHRKYRDLDQFKKMNIQNIQEKFLYDLLNGGVPMHQIASQWKECSLDIRQSDPLLVIVVKIDHYASFVHKYSDSDKYLMKYALKNIADEIISLQFNCECMNAGDDHIVIFVNLDGSRKMEDQISEQMKLLREIQVNAQNYLSVSVSAFISDGFESIQDLPYVYQETLQLSNYRIKHGHQCILTKDSMNDELHEDVIIDNELFNRLLDAIKEGKLKTIEEAFENIVSSLKRASFNNMMMVITHLTSSIFNLLNIMEKNNTVTFYVEFSQFEKHVQKLETLEEIDTAFRELFQSIMEQMKSNKAQKSKIIVDNAMNYIEQHYTDPQLSASFIADFYQLTPAYLNKLFRMHTTQSIVGSITNIRLEQAKHLLEASDLTIDEIVNQIGWENKKYFFTVFKKQFGATPNDYRLKANIDHLE
jgi:two-component system response regulator YesN